MEQNILSHFKIITQTIELSGLIALLVREPPEQQLTWILIREKLRIARRIRVHCEYHTKYSKFPADM